MSAGLAPGFLVAAPSLLDPNFHRSVVLLVEHHAQGALGFVINRPATATLGALFGELGLDPASDVAVDAPVMVGGPVSPNTGWIVMDWAEGQAARDDVVVVAGGIGVSTSRDVLASIARGEGPARHLLVLGYAGWGPGQLDDEIRAGAWIPVDLDARIVFDLPFDGRWRAALAVLGIDPARIVGSTVPEA